MSIVESEINKIIYVHTHTYVNRITLSISNSLVILEQCGIPLYGNLASLRKSDFGLVSKPLSKLIDKARGGERREREKEAKRRALFDRHLSDSRARYTTRSNGLLKGIFLCDIVSDPRILVRNESLVSPDDIRAFSIARTDSLAKPPKREPTERPRSSKWQRQAFPSSLIAITPGRLTVYETSLRKGAAIRTPRDNGVPMHKGIRRSPVNNVRMYIATRLRYLRGNAASLRKLTNRSAGRRVNQNQLSTWNKFASYRDAKPVGINRCTRRR